VISGWCLLRILRKRRPKDGGKDDGQATETVIEKGDVNKGVDGDVSKPKASKGITTAVVGEPTSVAATNAGAATSAARGAAASVVVPTTSNDATDVPPATGTLACETAPTVKAGVAINPRLGDASPVNASEETKSAPVEEGGTDPPRGRHRGREKEPDRDFVQFFRDLDITDKNKIPFLAGLLRNFLDAAAKLDAHLVVYSASVHAAVSRMVPPASPYELPHHLWIRVHDRLGFFHDLDKHAQRLVNIGLSYAYRHMEIDALAVANAKVLKDISRQTGVFVGDIVCEDAGRIETDKLTVYDAGSVVAGTHGDRAAAADGCVDHVARGGNAHPREAAHMPNQPPLRPTCGNDAGALDADSSDSTGEHDGSDAPPLDHVAADGRRSSAPLGEAASRGGDVPTAARQVLQAEARPVFARQPVLTPDGSALAVVIGALSSMGGRVDAEDACREIFVNSIKLFVGNHECAKQGAVPYTSERCWSVLAQITSVWWPKWEAATGRAKPVPGTVAFIRSSGRLAAASRWCYKVKIASVHEALKTLSAPAARCLQHPLPDTVDVERITVKDKPKLTALVASMLLLACKEEDYAAALTELVAAGVDKQAQVLPLSVAKCQSFTSPGLLAPAATVQKAMDVASPSVASAAPSCGLPRTGAQSFFDGVSEPTAEMYAAVKSAGVQVAVNVSKDVRAQRREQLKERRASRGGQSASAPVPSRQGVRIAPSPHLPSATRLPVTVSLTPPLTPAGGLPHPQPGATLPLDGLPPRVASAASVHPGSVRLPLAPPPRRPLPPANLQAVAPVTPVQGTKRPRLDHDAYLAPARVSDALPPPMPASPFAVHGYGGFMSSQPSALVPSWASPLPSGEPPGMPLLTPPQSATQVFATRRLERDQQTFRVEASYAAARASLSQLIDTRYPADGTGGSPSPSQEAFGRP